MYEFVFCIAFYFHYSPYVILRRIQTAHAPKYITKVQANSYSHFFFKHTYITYTSIVPCFIAFVVMSHERSLLFFFFLFKKRERQQEIEQIDQERLYVCVYLCVCCLPTSFSLLVAFSLVCCFCPSVCSALKNRNLQRRQCYLNL